MLISVVGTKAPPAKFMTTPIAEQMIAATFLIYQNPTFRTRLFKQQIVEECQ